MLKNIKKGIATFGVLCILLCGTIYLPVNAADTTTYQGKGDVSYDMEVGGTQEFDVITEDGQEAHVTITEIPSMSRVANGTYRVKYDLTGCWIAGFNVKVSNNSFVSVSSPFHTIRLGYISSPKLTLNSSKMATYSFNYHTGVAASYTGVRATISGTTLNADIL